ncbi:MAG TPA: SpoIIE family protein phosphatase [Gemmataceae bacterium]|jgi:serine phosphatase RsbU (regulator of sigma subunit)|nr:SpoIIE family protein phosphatase [Gemmataceae bacterium]
MSVGVLPQLDLPPHNTAGPAARTASVLLVDDQPRNLLALEAILGDVPLNVVTATSGQEALRHVLRQDFALILMDVMMPDMDGFETAELIRQRKRSRHTPIIFMTAFAHDDVHVFKGYSHGAVDYLLKPIAPEVLRSKVAVFVDIFSKTEEVKHQAELLRQLEQREHERQLAEVREQLESERVQLEMRIARQIQQKLFPVAPLPLPGCDISGASHPAEATGGDYFDYVPTRDGGLGIVIGDVSGHGYGPALLMAQTRAYLRAFLLTHTELPEIIALLNRALFDDTLEGRFTTLLFTKFDPQTRSVQHVSAGHTTSYVLDAAGTVKAELRSTGMPLGVVADGEFEASDRLPLVPGDILVLLTDGVVEAHDAAENLFGTDRVLAAIRAHRDRPAREIVAEVFQAVNDFCGTRSQFDDMTLVVVKVGEAT